MKLGYSILLGEIVAAENLDYNDCRDLQIVCPECREPIFKGLREKGSGETHYLSHYDKKIAYNTDCENRVGGLSSENIAKSNQQAGNQRLKLFMSVLKNLLGKNPIYKQSLNLTHRKLERSASFCAFRGYVYEALRSAPIDEIIEIMTHDYRAELERAGWQLATTFPIGVQERIAGDMYRTLIRPIARKNLDLLFSHAFMMVSNSYAQPGVKHDPDEQYVIDRIGYHMHQIATQRKKRQVDHVMAEMVSEHLPPGFNQGEGPTTDEAPSSYFMRIAGNIQTEMFEQLVELPYYEILHSEYADASKDYPYVSGVEPATDEEKKRVGLKLH